MFFSKIGKKRGFLKIFTFKFSLFNLMLWCKNENPINFFLNDFFSFRLFLNFSKKNELIWIQPSLIKNQFNNNFKYYYKNILIIFLTNFYKKILKLRYYIIQLIFIYHEVHVRYPLDVQLFYYLIIVYLCVVSQKNRIKRMFENRVWNPR